MSVSIFQDEIIYCHKKIGVNYIRSAQKLSRRVSSIVNKILSPEGITCSQFFIMEAIINNLSHVDILLHLGVDRTTLLRSLVTMVELDLISKVVKRDSRSPYYVFTKNGREVFKKCVPMMRKFSRQLQIKLAGRDYEEL